jgi:hypothetical protein
MSSTRRIDAADPVDVMSYKRRPPYWREVAVTAPTIFVLTITRLLRRFLYPPTVTTAKRTRSADSDESSPSTANRLST